MYYCLKDRVGNPGKAICNPPTSISALVNATPQKHRNVHRLTTAGSALTTYVSVASLVCEGYTQAGTVRHYGDRPVQQPRISIGRVYQSWQGCRRRLFFIDSYRDMEKISTNMIKSFRKQFTNPTFNRAPGFTVFLIKNKHYYNIRQVCCELDESEPDS